MRTARTLSIMAAGMAILVLVTAISAGPRAKIVSSKWQLDVKFYDPIRLVVTLPGDDKPTTFWYMLYTVENNTGEDVEFYPSFELMTDTFKTVVGGDNISPSVVQVIKARYQKQYPFFVDPMKAAGKLLQGKDNARTSCVVFRDFDPKASSFTIFAAGFSGDIVRVNNPAFDKDKPKGEGNQPYFLLRRTLALEYQLPGEPRTRHLAKPKRLSREWVLR